LPMIFYLTQSLEKEFQRLLRGIRGFHPLLKTWSQVFPPRAALVGQVGIGIFTEHDRFMA